MYPIVQSLWGESWFQGFLLNLVLVLLFLIYRFFVHQIRREERIRLEFEKRLHSVEMTALRSQMNPHFIFNCLNSIDYYILKNETEKASDYLNRFSRLIRLILQNSRSNYINLKDEMEALRLYIEMESLRFHHQFKYRIRVQNDLQLADYEIPPMLLQPYVENAIWHGLLHKEKGGELEVQLTYSNNHLFFIIQDNGIGREISKRLKSKTATRKKSMGLQITEDRVTLINRLYDTTATIFIRDLKNTQNEPVGTRVELTIPV